MLKLVSLASVLAVTLAKPLEGLPAPRCTNSIARFTASATNFDLSSGTLPPNATVPTSGTFGVQLRYCEPTVKVHSREDTIQILVHGITYNTEYWDTEFEPETYSYVRFAAARGYATLNMARLAHGKSDHPDPVAIIQTPFETAIIESIIKAARSGDIPGATHGFGTVVYLGHSIGSALLNGVIINEPALVDAAVLTGYGHDLSKTGDYMRLLGLAPARDVDPARFGALPPDYQTTGNETNRAAMYGVTGSLDPAALAFDEAHKDTVTTSEFLTLAVPITTAPQFQGDVFTINGDGDIIFCTQPGCANLASEGQFYPAAKSVEFAVVPLAGHSLNYHLSAPATYTMIQAWLTRHGY